MNKNKQLFQIRSKPETSEDDGVKKISGLIPFNSRSEWLGFYEVITPTAFNKTLADGSDVLALMSHDESKILARTKNDTLTLTITDEGLKAELIVPDTSYGKDAYELIRSGLVPNMSFGFIPLQEKTERDPSTGEETRYLTEVKLFEVSFCVGSPAYTQTSSLARNKRNIDLNELNSLLDKDAPEAEKIDDYIKVLTEIRNGLKSRDTEAVKKDTSAETLKLMLSVIRK